MHTLRTLLKKHPNQALNSTQLAYLLEKQSNFMKDETCRLKMRVASHLTNVQANYLDFTQLLHSIFKGMQ